MATLVLGMVGRALLGPIGGIAGTLLGSSIDQRLLGGRRSGPRLANPELQVASYGQPIPVVAGRMRVSGNMVWCSGIRETATRSGGGKRGPATTNYSYSASFAVILCAGPIAGIGRVWADGRLIRDAAGVLTQPVTMRVHDGGEGQAGDPLIIAAEGAAPAFRGLAHVVFEDLALAEFGNRLPNLAFEINPDSPPQSLGTAMAALAARAGVALPARGAFPAVTGLFAGAAAPLADVIGPALRASGAVLAGGAALVGDGLAATPIDPAGQDQAEAGGGRRGPKAPLRRAGSSGLPDAVELAYYDDSRDFQPGLQRARLRAGVRVDNDVLPLALSPALARQLALTRLLRQQAGRRQRSLRLPWRFLGLAPGDVIALPDGDWQVTETRFEAFVLHVELVQRAGSAAMAAASDGGRALAQQALPAGPTRLLALDVPPLPGELPDGPRLWLAGAGAAPGWRGADVELSLDGGASFVAAGRLPGAAVLGSALTVLGPADPAGWDRHGVVEVELLAEAMWLEGRSENSVLAGANLALLGAEIIQFTTATALGNRRFALSGLLRGRRGSEWAVAGHAVGEDFVLLDPDALLALPLPLERLGEPILLRPVGLGDAGALPLAVPVGAGGIRPLAPVHLAARRTGGLLDCRWIPASRAGFGWPDFTDVPLGERSPAWRVQLADAGGITLAEAEVTEPRWQGPAPSGPCRLAVAQLGLTLGRTATLMIA
ncbi:MAG: hypothetical protein KGQ52_14690 [Alphaproteobacteria bacterium]|nr:hypothetical protein [Alphaproteobacteria bacterium]